MIRLPRTKWVLAVLIVLAAALGAATLRAAAQSVMTGSPAPQPHAAAAALPGRSLASPAPADQAKEPSDQAPAPAAPAPTPRPGAGRDDAKAAPEIRGSADNNVSFPVDI